MGGPRNELTADALTVLRSLPDAVVVCDADGTIRYLNPAAESLFERPTGDGVGEKIDVLVELSEGDSTLGSTGTGRRSTKGRGRLRDGTSFGVDVTLSRLRLHGGDFAQWSIRQLLPGGTDDAQIRLLVTALQHSATGTEFTDPDVRILWVNRAFTELTGYQADEVIGKRPMILRPIGADPRPYEEITRTVTEGRVWRGEIKRRRKDGTLYDAYLTVSPIHDEKGQLTHLIAHHDDVTERRMMQARMLRTDRLVSMGALAAGVAHEINNPLAFIIANLEYLTDGFRELMEDDGRSPAASDEKNEPRRSQLGEMSAALTESVVGARRVRDIVRDLQTFSRVEQEGVHALSLEPILASVINMARTEIRHRARLVMQLGALPPVMANESRLAQIFLNLILNAVQAIREGDAEKNELRVVTRTDPSGRAVVEVHDTGCGITQEVREKIFLPFFTTKPPGEGTGLGLAICQNLMSAIGGDIEVESEVGKGSSFRLLFPAATPESDRPESKPTSTDELHARILVIDDEPSVGTSIRRLLSTCTVLSTESAKGALEIFSREPPFDVVLCDIMMPEMSGPDLHDLLERSGRQELLRRFVFMTGGAFTASAREFLARVHQPRIDKPFDRASLTAVIRVVLER